MTKSNLQVPARRVNAALPGSLAVGEALIELVRERTANGGSHARRFEAVWTKGTARGTAWVDVRPTSKLTTEITVTLARPTGPAGWLWLPAVRRRLAALFANGLAYEIETRSIEETDGFQTRRTSPELVRARTA
jgi:hypothetical protein